MEIASGILLLIGALAMLVGGIGILRMPDLFTRLHAVGITDTLGAAAILLGLAFIAGWGLLLVKLLLILAPTRMLLLACVSGVVQRLKNQMSLPYYLG